MAKGSFRKELKKQLFSGWGQAFGECYYGGKQYRSMNRKKKKKGGTYVHIHHHHHWNKGGKK